MHEIGEKGVSSADAAASPCDDRVIDSQLSDWIRLPVCLCSASASVRSGSKSKPKPKDKNVRPPGQLSLAHMFQRAPHTTAAAVAAASNNSESAAAAATSSPRPHAAAAAAGGNSSHGGTRRPAAAAAADTSDPAWDPSSLRRKVVQRTDKQRFELSLPAGGQAILDYSYTNVAGGSQVVLDLTHTAVPLSAQGRGIAALLVQQAFEFARKEQIRVRPSCSYIHTFIGKHPQWKDTLEAKQQGRTGDRSNEPRGAGADTGGGGGGVGGKTFRHHGNNHRPHHGGSHHSANGHAAAASSSSSFNQQTRNNQTHPTSPQPHHSHSRARVDDADSPRSGDKRRSPSNFDVGVDAEWKTKRGRLDEAALKADHLAPPNAIAAPVARKPPAPAAAAAAASSSSTAPAASSAAPPSSSSAKPTKPMVHIPPGFVPLPCNPQFARKWNSTLAVIGEALAPGSSSALSAPMVPWGSVDAAVDVMRRLAMSRSEIDTRCLGMQFFFDVYLGDEERARYLHHTLPFMMRLIRDMPQAFDIAAADNGNLKHLPAWCLPTLRTNVESTLHLTKLQLVTLLSCSFFGLQVEHVPRRGPSGGELRQFKSSNFDGLWLSVGRAVRHALGTNDTPEEIRSESHTEVEKLKCLLIYFEAMRGRVDIAADQAHPQRDACRTILRGIVTFHRKVLRLKRNDIEVRMMGASASSAASASASGASSSGSSASSNLPLCPINLRDAGTIEDDGYGTLQIDFANKFLGGGVLTRGCVQEEIRLTINPESLVGLLFVEVMDEHESVTIIGAERFTNYTGYSSTFACAGPHADPTPVDPVLNRMKTVIVAIDAISFRYGYQQFKREPILREILKAYAGFALEDSVIGVRTGETAADEARMREQGALTSYLLPVDGSAPPHVVAPMSGVTDVPYTFHEIATGNWGCGAFGGEVPLKTMIQLLAATLAHRRLRYFTFASDTCDGLAELLSLLSSRRVSVRDLYVRVCLKYNPMRRRGRSTAEYVRDLLDGVDEQKVAALKAEEERQRRLAAVQQRLDQQTLDGGDKPMLVRAQPPPAAAAAAGTGASAAASSARHANAASSAAADLSSLEAQADLAGDADDPIEDFPDDGDQLPDGYDSEAERAMLEEAQMEMDNDY